MQCGSVYFFQFEYQLLICFLVFTSSLYNMGMYWVTKSDFLEKKKRFEILSSDRD